MYAAGEVTLEEVKPNIMSYYGILQHFNSHKLTRKILEEFVLQRAAPEEQQDARKEVEE